MTDQHYPPITPPPEMVQEWLAEIWYEGTPVRVAASDLHITTQAARWGADQELEACCEWLASETPEPYINALRLARRPKQPSFKDQIITAIFCDDKSLALKLLNQALPE